MSQVSAAGVQGVLLVSAGLSVSFCVPVLCLVSFCAVSGFALPRLPWLSSAPGWQSVCLDFGLFPPPFPQGDEGCGYFLCHRRRDSVLCCFVRVALEVRARAIVPCLWAYSFLVSPRWLLAAGWAAELRWSRSPDVRRDGGPISVGFVVFETIGTSV